MRNLKNWIVTATFALLVGGSLVAIVNPQPIQAAQPAGSSGCKEYPILGLPVWYRGLVDGNCNMKSPAAAGGLSTYIWKIVLNVIDILLRVVGYISVGFILFGGFIYMTSTGSSDGIAKAKKTITNAVIGLVISIAAVAIVNLVIGAVA